MKVYVIHENPDWYPPIAAAFDALGVPSEQWLLGEEVIDLDAQPPAGVFWSRMSASSHTRDHPYAKDQTRGVLGWLERHGRRVINGRRVIELEMSKVEQHTALRASGFDVPRTIAVAGTPKLADAARRLPAPFISKHNQGGKGLGVRLFESHEEFDAYVDSDEFEAPVDGITLLQEYLRAAEPRITRAEIVGREFIYAITANTELGGFQLCPADACAIGDGPVVDDTAPPPSLFALREGFDHPIIGRYLDFARRHGIEIAGFEFIETADGRLVTYDINTNTNYNPEIEAVAPRSAQRAVASFLGSLLDDEIERAA
ncbi:MAG TPA: hypothetical protein VFI65_22085 [Streptosporangiaceae bacterium]|nr:hypothetical protein [Streptosporangiaceae bacterium]